MLFGIVEILIVTLCCLAASVRCLHVFQMERYQLPSYTQWVRRNRDKFLKGNVVIGFAAVAVDWYLPILLSLFIAVEGTRNSLAGWLTLLGFAAVTVPMAVRDMRAPSKKPFAITARSRRLLIVLGVLYLVFALVMELLTIPPYVAYAVVPYVAWLAGRIMDPVEAKINAGFYNEARKKLRAREDLIRIGITGSYGKTLTKFILRELLSKRYEVLATPASFNTAMGISRVVNDQLEKKHQVFIAEMGAQHVGDIKNLVKLVRPQYGVITSVGPQHLDSFGSMANVADTKYELVDGLPENGVAFFAADSGYSDRLFSMCKKEKYSAAVEKEGDFYMRAVEISTDSKGTRFVLECSDGERIRCRTRLLGRYNVQNIALSAAIARRLGLSMEEIAAGVGRLQPFEKKLQLIPGEQIVIDDTLNDNPLATAEALSVLSEFPGRRIVVTSGLTTEDGKQDEINYAFGTQMKGCADAVILIGNRHTVRPLVRGILSTGFPKGAVHLVKDLDDAADLLSEIAGAGDTVLYEGEAREVEE